MESDPSSFDNSFKDLSRAVQDHVTSQLRLKIDRVMAIVKRDEDAAERKRAKSQRSAASQSAKSATSEGIIAALRHTYEGPGIERPQGHVFCCFPTNLCFLTQHQIVHDTITTSLILTTSVPLPHMKSWSRAFLRTFPPISTMRLIPMHPTACKDSLMFSSASYGKNSRRFHIISPLHLLMLPSQCSSSKFGPACSG